MTFLSPEDLPPSAGQTLSELSREDPVETLVAQMMTWLEGASVLDSQEWGLETMDAIGALAVWLLEHNRPSASATTFEIALRRQPDDMRLLKGLAVALETCGDGASAKQIWQRLHQMAPHDPENHFLWAQSLCRMGDRQRGMGLMQSLWQSGPETAALPTHVKGWLETWRGWAGGQSLIDGAGLTFD